MSAVNHKSATPLTEAWVMDEYGDRPGKPLTAAECLEFARRLERERAQLVEALRELHKEAVSSRRVHIQPDSLIDNNVTALLRSLGELE